ncbi:hypothetical protein SAMN05216351_1238 [Pseudobutyrivibrio sp. JW11]|uniref:DUF5677 domain-containing protein n=1 Tax=Pseudobutyrivibrio sp. JW11 TaxID=1855302 RepID=UPI0008E7F52D|nr:DUF5677 domain-containing protein [Pseudobutyrivibrio sp. JW11]SFO64855.1 hypothetical protein SAMN05216351_1238 [Pseudobutyrivibrio sp. JW11]
MIQRSIEKYLLKDLFEVISKVENQVLYAIRNEKLLGNLDDIDLLVPALTTSISLTRQIILLCENGFPDGSLILARNIYEQRIICSFIEEREDTTEREELLKRYFQDAELTRLKYLNEQAKRFSIIDDMENTDRLIKEHQEKYGSSFKQYWWSGKNSFKELSDVITNREDSHRGLFNNMHMEYKMACIAMHPSAFGNRMNIGSKVVGVDMRIRDTGHEHALFLATASLISLVGHTYHYLELDDSFVLNELNRLGEHYCRMLI